MQHKSNSMSIASIPHGDPLTNVGNVAAGSVLTAVWTGLMQNPLSSILTILSIIWFTIQIARAIDDWVNKKKEPPSQH